MLSNLDGTSVLIETYPVYREGLKWRGKYIDNGILSNLTQLSSPIIWRGQMFDNVEAAYVAEKNPFVIVDGVPFIDYVAAWCRKNGSYGVKTLGIPKSRGGLIDARPDWDITRISVMLSLQALKYAPGRSEALWLKQQRPEYLVEHNNWHDRFWGAVMNKDQTISRGRDILGELVKIIQECNNKDTPMWVIPEPSWATTQAYIVNKIIERRAQRRLNGGGLS